MPATRAWPASKDGGRDDTSVDVREITGGPDWDDEALARDWRRITGASPAATLFQSWEWVHTWWAFHGNGGRRLWVLEFRDNGAPVGFAPLFLPAHASPLRTVRFLGTGGSDYGDIVALPEYEAAVAGAFWRFLGECRRRWDWADLQQVRPGAVVLRRVPEPWESAVRVARWSGETCPYLPLPADWESFRRGLGKKRRSNLGYYERALGKEFEVEWRVATPDTLREDLDAFFELHQRRWNRRWLPGAFASRRARAFHETVAARALEHGMLRLHTLALDGEIQAALYCFQCGARCSYYLGGFEPGLGRLSPGTLLTARAIRHAIEVDAAAEFDFLRGDEPYKYAWGARDRRNLRVSATQRGARSLALAAAGRASLAGELALKTWMHRRHGGGGAARPASARTAANAADRERGDG
jgi:CelD/BcsL family acetyltransferase involved in cellulose biosynthesis